MKRRPFTAVEEEFIRAAWGEMTGPEIAARLGRPRGSINGCVRRLQLRSERYWDDAEQRYLKRWYGQKTAEEIADDLARSVRSVYMAARTLGVARRLCPTGREFLLHVLDCQRLHWCNPHIAAAWSERFPDRTPIDRHTVADRLAEAGLPASKGQRECSLCKTRTAETTRRQCAAAGVLSLAEIRTLAFRRYAQQHGWPEDLRPRHVQMLDALALRGPMTRFEIAQAIGMPWKGSRASLHSNDYPGGTYLTNLMRRGLVVKLGRCVRTGRRGGNVNLYSLALDVQRGTG